MILMDKINRSRQTFTRDKNSQFFKLQLKRGGRVCSMGQINPEASSFTCMNDVNSNFGDCCYFSGGVLHKFLYGEAPPWGPTPYDFIYLFWQKRYPFRTPSIDKWYPFHIPSLELCKYEYITKPEHFLFSPTATKSSVALLGHFTDRNDRFFHHFIHFNKWNPYPLVPLKPGKGTTFGRSLPVQVITGSTPGGYYALSHSPVQFSSPLKPLGQTHSITPLEFWHTLSSIQGGSQTSFSTKEKRLF